MHHIQWFFLKDIQWFRLYISSHVHSTTRIHMTRYHFPMQNLLNMPLRTSLDMSSPLIVARANATSLKSIVEKSIGSFSMIDDSSLLNASRVLRSCSNCLVYSPPSSTSMHVHQEARAQGLSPLLLHSQNQQ